MLSWSLGDLPQLLVLSAAALAALAYLIRALRRGLAWCRMVARQLRAVGDIVERELEQADGDGTSMKDDVHHIALAVGLLQRRAQEQARKQRAQDAQLNELRQLIDHHHPTGPVDKENGDK